MFLYLFLLFNIFLTQISGTRSDRIPDICALYSINCPLIKLLRLIRKADRHCHYPVVQTMWAVDHRNHFEELLPYLVQVYHKAGKQ